MTGDRSGETPSHLAQTFPGPQVAHVRGEMFGIADIGPVDGPFLLGCAAIQQGHCAAAVG